MSAKGFDDHVAVRFWHVKHLSQYIKFVKERHSADRNNMKNQQQPQQQAQAQAQPHRRRHRHHHHHHHHHHYSNWSIGQSNPRCFSMRMLSTSPRLRALAI